VHRQVVLIEPLAPRIDTSLSRRVRRVAGRVRGVAGRTRGRCVGWHGGCIKATGSGVTGHLAPGDEFLELAPHKEAAA